jgi:hypothetical protein
MLKGKQTNSTTKHYISLKAVKILHIAALPSK